MPEESESKSSRRVERQSARKKQPQNVRLGIFLTESDADSLDVEAAENGLSVSAYLRILVARGHKELKAEAVARAAEAETRSRMPSPQDALAAARRKAEEDRLQGDRDRATSKAIRRGTVMPPKGR